jgi:hypothetical protein
VHLGVDGLDVTVAVDAGAGVEVDVVVVTGGLWWCGAGVVETTFVGGDAELPPEEPEPQPAASTTTPNPMTTMREFTPRTLRPRG